MTSRKQDQAPMTAAELRERYLKREMHRVRGYLLRLDAQLFQSLLEAQTRESITGGLVEIGVHHGRSFFIMALCREGDEKSLAIDLFEDDEKYSDPSGLGRSGHFRQNQARLDIDLGEDEVLKGSSLELKPNQILERVGPVRFFSIDGGHHYEHVENDLALAQETLLDEGIIVIDDFANASWPEVTFATYDWLRGAGNGYAPFATTQTKLYVCQQEHRDRYRAAIAADAALAPNIGADVDFLGNKVTQLTRSAKVKAIDAVSSRLFTADHSRPWRR